jgi:hypothetical protein
MRKQNVPANYQHAHAARISRVRPVGESGWEMGEIGPAVSLERAQGRCGVG